MDKIRKALVHKLLQYRPPHREPCATNDRRGYKECRRCVWISGEGNRRLCPFPRCVLRAWDLKGDLIGLKNGKGNRD